MNGYTRGELTVHHEPAELTKVTRALRGVGRQVALVPTMGALHAGHLELVRQAKLRGAVVVVSIFVNPLQFAAGEDLDAYPRTLDADLELLRGEGVELAFAPTAAAMYPSGQRTMIHPGPIGAERPATPMRPRRYPNGSWRNVRSPRAAIPGTEITVSAEVSVATIENMIAHHGSPRRPRK